MDLKRKVSTFQRYISHSSMGREMIHITSYQESTPNTPFPACIAWSEWQEQPPLLCHPQTTDKGIRLLLPTAGGRVLYCKPSASTASVYHSIMLEWDLMADKHLYSTHPMIKYVEMQTSWNIGMLCKHTLSGLLNHDYIAISRQWCILYPRSLPCDNNEVLLLMCINVNLQCLVSIVMCSQKY